MVIPVLAVILGALIGIAIRGRKPAVLTVAIAAPVLAVLAFAAQLVPGGAEECSSSASGVDVCKQLPAITAWSGLLPFLIAFLLILLALAPLISVRTKTWWIAAASAGLQAIAQVVSFGAFVAWAPALLATVIVAFAVTE